MGPSRFRGRTPAVCELVNMKVSKTDAEPKSESNKKGLQAGQSRRRARSSHFRNRESEPTCDDHVAKGGMLLSAVEEHVNPR